MPLGKVSVKSNNAELALSTLMLGRKQEGGKKGADREKEERKRRRQRGNKKSLEGEKKNKSKKIISKLFTLVNQALTSFQQHYAGKGFTLFGESTFEFCQHLSRTEFEKGPIFLGSQRRVGLLTPAGNRRCGIRIQEGGRENLSFLSNGFLPLFKCKIRATVLLTTQIRLLGGGGVSGSELYSCSLFFSVFGFQCAV